MKREECDCPVCNGTGRRPAGNEPYKKTYAGYDPETDTLACHNCGGQTMWGRATGKTWRRDDGTPCVHEYTSYQRGRCWTQYTCKHCSYSFDIDSSD